MPTPAPRPRGDASLRDRLRTERKDSEQIRRQRVEQPKPKTATTVGGSMQGFTRATPADASWGVGGVQPRGWSFDSGVDPSPGVKPGLVAGGDGVHFGVAAPGYYMTHQNMQFTVSSGPDVALIQGNNMSMDLSAFGEAWAHNTFDGRYRASFWCGPFWLDATDAPLGVEAFGAFGPGTVLATFVDVWRVG